jgi:hypothetical protein
LDLLTEFMIIFLSMLLYPLPGLHPGGKEQNNHPALRDRKGGNNEEGDDNV